MQGGRALVAVGLHGGGRGGGGGQAVCPAPRWGTQRRRWHCRAWAICHPGIGAAALARPPVGRQTDGAAGQRDGGWHTFCRERLHPVLVGHQRVQLLARLLLARPSAQRVCGRAGGDPVSGGDPGWQGAAAGGLTVEGGEGHGRLAAEVVVFVVGVRGVRALGSGKGHGRRGCGARWG